MNKKVRILLVEFLHNRTIISSWGISDINITKSEVSFNVSALKYKGRIIIKTNKENESIYEVEYVAHNNHIEKSNISNIVSRIDKQIESSSTYYTDLLEWLKDQQ